LSLTPGRRVRSPVAVSPDGKQVLSGSGNYYAARYTWTSDVAFSPDRRHVLTADNDGVVRLWKMP
jgi:WD40 repeat protein